MLINTYARVVRADDYPHGIPLDRYNLFIESLVHPAPVVAAEEADDLPLMAPSRLGDPAFRSWWRQAGHRGASPATALAMLTLARDSDVRDLLPEIQAPTLVVHARDNRFVGVEHGRYLADHTPRATYHEISSADHLPWTDDTDLIGEIEEFLTGTRHAALGNRRLATVLFTDIVGSTEAVRILGDQAWRDRLDRHDLLGRMSDMGATRRKFTLEFKTEAAHRVIDTGRTVAEVAAELSVVDSVLARWVRDERRRLDAVAGSIR